MDYVIGVLATMSDKKFCPYVRLGFDGAPSFDG